MSKPTPSVNDNIITILSVYPDDFITRCESLGINLNTVHDQYGDEGFLDGLKNILKKIPGIKASALHTTILNMQPKSNTGLPTKAEQISDDD